MMKKTLLTVAFVSSMSLLTACSETPYAPPVGQQAFTPNMYPANNVIPNQQFPGQPIPAQPGQFQPGQPIPAQPGINSQYQLSAYAYLQSRNQSCFTVVQSRSAYQCGCGYVSSTPCKIVYVKRKMKKKNCRVDCEVIQVVAITAAEARAQNIVVDNSSNANEGPVAFRLDESHTSDPNIAKINSYANNNSNRQQPDNRQVDNRQPNNQQPDNKQPENQQPDNQQPQPQPQERIINPIAKRAKGELPLDEYYEFIIRGADARAIYDRLNIEADKKRESVRRGPNIECDIDGGKRLISTPDSAFNCKVTVQMIEKDGIKVGELRMKENPGKTASPKTDLSKAYPEIASHMDSVLMKAGREDIQIFLPATSNEAKSYHPGNILLEMPGEELEGYADEAQTIRAKYKMSKSLKCYRTINQDVNVTKCYIQINVKTGTASDITI